VLFIDKPSADAPTGIYGVNIAQPEPTPVLVTEMIGFYNYDRSLVATLEGADLLRLTRVATGESWTLNTKGNPPKFSPDGKRVLWTARDEDGPYDQRVGDIWLSNLDGSQPKQLLTMYGGGFGDWLADSQRFLLVSKLKPNVIEVTLSIYDITKNSQIDLFTERQLRQVKLSTGGRWVAFYAMFAEDATRSGLWLLSTDGQSQRQLDVPRFGAYQWQNDDTLIYLPIRATGETSMQLWAIDAVTARLTPLTDPQQLPFVVGNGDWEVSPDGRQVVFVNSADNNIWLIDLP
jgi:Tol biopolymer transport system component